MRGRSKLIARSHLLQGETVNGLQQNPTAGVGRADDVQPPKPKQQPRRRRPHPKPRALVYVKNVAFKTHRCPDCGTGFPSEIGMTEHQHRVHGTAPTSVGDMSRCSECGNLVKNKNMARHRLNVHGVS